MISFDIIHNSTDFVSKLCSVLPLLGAGSEIKSNELKLSEK